MDFSEEEIEEFRTEAQELLDIAETSLLGVEQGSPFTQSYDEVFRSFHSLKGAAGMLKLSALQSHMHQVESLFETFKSKDSMSPAQTSFFLKAIDAARQLLWNKPVTFDYQLPADGAVTTKSTPTPSEAQTSDTAPSPPQAQTSSASEPLVYIVDDEPALVSLLIDIVSETRYRVKSFTSALDALKHLPTDKPHVVLSDMKMPEMTGLDFLKNIRNLNLDTQVIFISAYLTKDILAEALQYGLFGVIEKPFNDTQVVTMTMNAANRYAMWKLVNQSVDLLLFQFSDLEQFLIQCNKQEVADIMKKEFEKLVKARKLLKKHSRQT